MYVCRGGRRIWLLWYGPTSYHHPFEATAALRATVSILGVYSKHLSEEGGQMWRSGMCRCLPLQGLVGIFIPSWILVTDISCCGNDAESSTHLPIQGCVWREVCLAIWLVGQDWPMMFMDWGTEDEYWQALKGFYETVSSSGANKSMQLVSS